LDNKKRKRRVWREGKLVASIRRGEQRQRQLQLAEDVRLARIRQLRSYRALIIPTFRDATERLKQFDAKIAALERKTAKQILAEFRTLEARHAKRLTKHWS
jgi:hypothetical protein